jgi:exodeoxyribonuclease VII large subunit
MSLTNAQEFSVSEISNALKRVVESNFAYVKVRGEISGLKIAASGHVYLSLKDDKNVLSGVCWKGVASRLRFRPEDGLEVVATGKLTTYGGRSNYQIVIEAMEPAGAGALMALLEKRKKELAAEGLFDADRKKPLPYLPRTIGVITSPTGAVIRDILHRLGDRMPSHVLLWPVMVQGDGAAEQIAEAVRGFNRLSHGERPQSTSAAQGDAGEGQAHPLPQSEISTSPLGRGIDLLIVARGGGSIEDLWPFNEEVVVRAVADSEIPVISAVGHETDTTLIDYVSDQRAPTPTAAAEMAVPVRADLLYTLRDHQQRMDHLVKSQLGHYQQKIEGLARGLPKPSDILANARQAMDVASDKLSQSLRMMVTAKQHQLAQAAQGLRPHLLRHPLQEQQRQLKEQTEGLTRYFTQLLERKNHQLENLSSKLSLLDHRQVLKRGFALVKAEDGSLVTSNKQINKARKIEFHDGEADLTGNADKAKPSAPKKAAPKKILEPMQESLF